MIASRRAAVRRASRSIRAHLMVAAILIASGCNQTVPMQYSADPIAATVVDAESGTPLAGVNVVAGWEVTGGLEGGNVVGWVKVMEAVTDESGQFFLPGWGPVAWTKGGSVKSESPLLILFKSGYDRRLLVQRKRSPIERAPSHMQSDWNGENIKLTRYAGSYEEYARRIAGFSVTLNSLLDNGECNWKSIPRFLWSLQIENDKFGASNLVYSFGSLEYLSKSFDRNCGSLKSYVLEKTK